MEKRSAAIAMTNMLSNISQIYAPYLYNKSTGPRYLPAMTANTIFVIAAISFATWLRSCLVKENQKLAKAEEVQHEVREDGEKDDEEIMQRGPGGVLRLNPGFRYIL